MGTFYVLLTLSSVFAPDAVFIGIGSDGPYVRVEFSSGGATCFWASAAAITQIESGLEAEKGTVWLSGASSIE